MTDGNISPVVTQADVARADASRADAEGQAKHYQELADQYSATAAIHAVVRDFMASRVGMLLERASAEVAELLVDAEAARARCQARIDQLDEERRDWLGYKRVMERQKAQIEAAAEPANASC
jgi:hypothetical protein